MQPVKLGACALLSVGLASLGNLALAPSGHAQAQAIQPSQPAVESSQQTNERIRALSASTRNTAPHDYVIGSGDVLAVEVFDVPELTREVRVNQTGTIGLPLVPVRLHVSGLTELQAAAKISEVLQANGLVSHPEVSVNVKERKSKPITIVGAVGHPMVYQADRQVTLVEVLAEAGGIANDAGDTVIISRPETDSGTDSSEPPVIGPDDAAPLTPPSERPASPTPPTRETKAAEPAVPQASTTPETKSALLPNAQEPPAVQPPPLTNIITVNLGEILDSGNLSNNVILQPGDVVTVPHAGIVYALGAVTRPGGYVVSNDRGQLTTLKLLALAGGLDHTAKSTQAVIVRRDSNGQQREVQVDLRKVMKFQSEDVRLQPSDILYIPKSVGKQAFLKSVEIGLAVGTGVLIYRLVP